jgi:hypothetical protein
MKIKSFFITLIMTMTSFIAVAQQPAGKVSALVFGDIYYYAQSDSSYENLKNTVTGGKESEVGLAIRRIYLTYDNKISPKIEARLRFEANDKTTGSGYIMPFIKDAYLKYNLIKQQYVLFGIIPTPAYEVSEGKWGHRYIEKMILDLRKVVSPRDFGVAFRGNIDTAGIFKYWFMIGENAGVKPETNAYKRYYGHIEINPLNNLCITAYADINERASIKNPYDTLGPNLSTTENTFALFAGYLFAGKLNVGAEGYINIIKHNYDNGYAMDDKKGVGITAFAGYSINEKFSLISRYDYFDFNIDKNARGDVRKLYIVGFTWNAHDNFLLTPNVMIENYESVPTGIHYKSSVTPRVTFYYKF